MLSDGLRLVVIGGLLGIAGAFAGARDVRSQLFGVEPGDPFTLVAVALVLLGAAIAACLVPARRAMRVDPALTLRSS